jgi:hypothetical protein
MSKKAKIFLLAAGASLLSLFFITYALAAPREAKVVNHKTKECAFTFAGDECSNCVPIGDWEILNGECPEGYTNVNEYIQSSCTLIQNQWCCTEGDSGSHNCTDLIVNTNFGLCTLIENNACSTFPDGWKESPHNLCPANYGWVDKIECVDSAKIPNENPSQNFLLKYVLIGSILVLVVSAILIINRARRG